MLGFLVSCDENQRRFACKEMAQTLQDLIVAEHGESPDDVVGGADLADEVKAARDWHRAGPDTRLVRAHSGVRGIAVLAAEPSVFEGLDPALLCSRVLHRARAEGVPPSRFVHRLVPFQVICQADTDSVADAVKSICDGSYLRTAERRAAKRKAKREQKAAAAAASAEAKRKRRAAAASAKAEGDDEKDNDAPGADEGGPAMSAEAEGDDEKDDDAPGADEGGAVVPCRLAASAPPTEYVVCVHSRNNTGFGMHKAQEAAELGVPTHHIPVVKSPSAAVTVLVEVLGTTAGVAIVERTLDEEFRYFSLKAAAETEYERQRREAQSAESRAKLFASSTTASAEDAPTAVPATDHEEGDHDRDDHEEGSLRLFG
jgi:hypothetical protein